MTRLTLPPPPLDRLTIALAAAITALVVAACAHAQTPPDCNNSICTARVAGVYGSRVVDGCGDHATPGRFKVILSSTNSEVTRDSFKTLIFLNVEKDESLGDADIFRDFEWRGGSRNSWNPVAPGNFGHIQFGGGDLGENIVEVRPKAGAHIWSNRDRNNPNQGPGELVIPVIKVQRSTGNRNYAHTGETYFLFMGGKGCARVNEGGEKIGGLQ